MIDGGSRIWVRCCRLRAIVAIVDTSSGRATCTAVPAAFVGCTGILGVGGLLVLLDRRR